jgi:hypothetical protein
VVVAAIVAALLVVVSIVIDLGGARNARAKDQNTADATALAGAAELDASGSNNQAACTAAFSYIVTNLNVSATPTPSCVSMAGTCDPTHARVVSITRGDYTISLINPVPDSDALFASQPAETPDGTACNRFGVKIDHAWHYVIEPGDTTLHVSAVSRLSEAPADVDAPLVILDPHGCGVMTVTGSSHVTTSTSTGAPGYVAVDSDGSSCTNGNKVILDATGSAQITAGAISMWALSTGNTARAYDPSDVGVGRAFNPAPIAASKPVGRSAVDWRYNCLASNGCPSGDSSAIAALVAADGSGAPTGYTRWTSLYSCSPSGNVIVPAGNWYIDCSGGLSSSDVLTFRGGNIVTDGAFNLTGNGSLRVNCDVSSSTAACPTDPASTTTLFMRNGGLNKSGNVTMSLRETFVYLADGAFDLTGTGTLAWTAPNDTSSPFDDLLGWSESTSTTTMTGNVDTTMEGIFFAPNSPLSLTGNTGTSALGSQMFVKTAALTGDSSLTLAPRSDRAMQLGGASSALIR